ncbi:DMT family transporter [Halomarina halobia]|uniref:DMT family transporter n=1 Tax=Halomarina halobia TaxID=3033386 RepID=A0ABD6ACA1_9EURY|nr:DMT family transporter [Halomarina sp. PSR21]
MDTAGPFRRLWLFVLAASTFGGVFVAVEVGLSYFPPLLFLALRFDLAAAFLLAYVAVTRERWRPRTRGDIAAVLVAGLLAIGLTNALLFLGQRTVPGAVASVVFSLAPVLTPAFALALLPGEKLSYRGLAGLLLGLVGVGLVVQPDPSSLLGGDVGGRVVLLGGALALAFGTTLLKRADAGIPSIAVVAWALPVSALVVHAASALAGESLAAVEWTPTAFATVGYVSVFGAAIAYNAYFELLDLVGPIEATLVSYAVPMVATVLSWTLLDRVVSATTVAGFAVIFLGFALLEYRTLRGIVPAVRAALDR